MQEEQKPKSITRRRKIKVIPFRCDGGWKALQSMDTIFALQELAEF